MGKKYRIIRKVMTTSVKDGRVKSVRDYTSPADLDRVKARSPRVCHNKKCDHLIDVNEEYIKIISLNMRMYSGSKSFPVSRDFHFNCVPSKFEPCLRFFRSKSDATS